MPRKPYPLARKIGARLRVLREFHGLKLEEVAELVGIGKGQLSRYENGKRLIPVDLLIRLTLSYEATMEFVSRGHEQGHDMPADIQHVFDTHYPSLVSRPKAVSKAVLNDA